MQTHHLHITGIVQGVGFRPFVYSLATRLGLSGWVCNTSAGVEIEIQGNEEKLQLFITSLQAEKPPLARMDTISMSEVQDATTFSSFTIRESTAIPGAFQPISADIAICSDCEQELFNPHDRRYLYPFINCTNCGPRFTIIKDIPYDRPSTTMAGFDLCPVCRHEYEDPLDRRFHAQPVACAVCGPHLSLAQIGKTPIYGDLEVILLVRKLLREGKIVAIKGLGGFHLACDATNPESVDELRRRKGRVDKPFALMAADLPSVKTICILGDHEQELLTSREKPIVLLTRTPKSSLPPSIAPGLDTIGVMLPYTPLHHLLLNQHDPILKKEPIPPFLVMTSGNYSEEPIATENSSALEKFQELADAILLHDRDIHIRCDDSVIRSDGHKQITFLRRSRGYAPYPVHLPVETIPTLAVGGELKNTFCLTRDRYAFLSHHIGDMENIETYTSFEQGVRHLSKLFRIQPEQVACDLHPNYYSTRWAYEFNKQIKVTQVQHHHAHIAACMADNELENRKIIGLAYDGTGYGSDGAIWGGEVLVADYVGFKRSFHLEYLPLAGGDVAIRKPWRIAIAYAHALGLDISDLPFIEDLEQRSIRIVRLQVDKEVNTVATSSMGRLFDAVAALVGIRSEVTYEAQAAIELEELSRIHTRSAESYPYRILGQTILLRDILESVIQSIKNDEAPGLVGARFHLTIVKLSMDVACRIREQIGLNEVALSGGVWQNKLLSELTIAGLIANGFQVFVHHQTPPNDGGIALGQAVIANHVKR